MRESPSLVQHCRKVRFTSDSTSICDAVRTEPEAHCLSTLEACAKGLELLENNNHNKTATPAKKATTNYLHAILQSQVDSHLVNVNMMTPRIGLHDLHAAHWPVILGPTIAKRCPLVVVDHTTLAAIFIFMIHLVVVVATEK
jgi:hypothetical protein